MLLGFDEVLGGGGRPRLEGLLEGLQVGGPELLEVVDAAPGALRRETFTTVIVAIKKGGGRDRRGSNGLLGTIKDHHGTLRKGG